MVIELESIGSCTSKKNTDHYYYTSCLRNEQLPLRLLLLRVDLSHSCLFLLLRWQLFPVVIVVVTAVRSTCHSYIGGGDIGCYYYSTTCSNIPSDPPPQNTCTATTTTTTTAATAGLPPLPPGRESSDRHFLLRRERERERESHRIIKHHHQQ